jgi:transposase
MRRCSGLTRAQKGIDRMKQNTVNKDIKTIGLDLGDTNSTYCVMDAEGRIISESTIGTSLDALTSKFGDMPRARIVLEACGQSNWIAKLLESFGHEVVVANPRQLHLISKSVKKTDRNDARLLARVGRLDLALLQPTHVRSDLSIETRTMLNARRKLVQSRTVQINSVRSAAKGFGQKLPSCNSDDFVARAKSALKPKLRALLQPTIDSLVVLQQQIELYDKEIERRCDKSLPQTEILRPIYGVGPQVALAYVAMIDDPSRFVRSRDVGPYIGLTPRRDQSGDSDPNLRISKHGDGSMRSLLVSAATHIMRKSAPDSDLKRFGEKVQGPSPTPRARARARIAVARKLAVLMHRLLKTGEAYEPLHAAQKPKTSRPKKRTPKPQPAST